ncbi:HK97 gp10 family phage protein [Phaeovulum vinaykumarii]|uniref:Bacteriophage HK97-gp10, putative tail-component n=1 Tax=Phaeovulum vinaykumarii TaxID=407234 RepID=A0A1N7K6E5_9RHOB|nr:HK97 gp10 family phage protein [Phaeovulum vinaykumarii]SIS57127.1 Bacteriophage HK97-gp10, putative tail-component [Phaeovulum vinaykumarii]SOB93285.1 bacteriophage HK97-gp10 putative tail-component [Phaeovulum vinaykumarii]
MAGRDLNAQAARLAKRLESIPDAVLEAVRPAVVQSAEDLANTARSLAPEAEGDLKASIVVTPPGAQSPAYAEGGGRRIAGENQALVTVGNPEQRHGHLVEFGTKPHVNGGQFAGTEHPGTTAQPFLLPAARLTDARARRRIGRAIGRAVRQIAQGGGHD